MNSEVLTHLKTTSHSEFNRFTVDFNVVFQKCHRMVHEFLELLPNIALGLVTLALFIMIGQVARRFIRRHTEKSKNANLGLVFARLSQVSFAVLGFFITLAIIFPSIKPVDLLGGFGVISLAVGFAFKDILKNFLSGIMILLQQPFRVGDEIKYHKFEGVVDFIDMRYTVLKSFDGRRLLIPNGEIYATLITVNTSYRSRTSQVEISIGLDNNLAMVSELILKTINSVSGVLAEPAALVLVTDIKANAIVLNISWGTSPYQSDLEKVKSDVLTKLKDALAGAHITIPVILSGIQIVDHGKREQEAEDKTTNHVRNKITETV
jgi:small-conductance mechanosensitive channel